MIDLVNGIILLICGIITGAAIHSLWRHAIERKETQDWNKIIRETDQDIIDIGMSLANMGGVDPKIMESLQRLHNKLID